MPLPTSFFEVFQAIRDGIKGKTITANAQSINLADGFFNPQPEQRNPENTERFPGLTLRTMSPVQGDLVVNEKVKCVVTVTAAPCWLDAVLPPTSALANGQTFLLRVGTEGPAEITTHAVQTVTFLAGGFVSIGAATPAEIAAFLSANLTGVLVALQPDGKTLRITHAQASAWASLQVSGGTAAALVTLFPTEEVWGRSAGDEVQYFDPPTFYNFPFQVIGKAKRMDHYALTMQVVEALYRLLGTPNQRAITVAGQPYEVIRLVPFDDPAPDEGVFYVVTPFLLRNVPFLRTDTAQLWDGGLNVGDPGNIQFPVVEDYWLRIAPAASWEDLHAMPDSQFEVVVEPAP